MKHLLWIMCWLSFSLPAHAWKVKRDEFNPAMIERYKGMLLSNPDDDFAFRKLVLLYQNHSSMDRLILEYRAILKKNPEHYQANAILGKLYLRIDRLDESLTHLQTALKTDDKRYEAHKLMGELHIRKRLYPEARGYLDQALERVTGAAIRERMLRELVRISILGGDLEGGARYFDSLIKLRPADFQTRRDYAELLTEAMQFEKAMVEYKTLLNMSAGDTHRRIDIMKATGVLLERMGKDTEAVELYWKTIALTASGHWVRNELIGRMVSIARRRDELPLLLREFRKRWPRPNAFQSTILASIHGELGEFDAAFSQYRAALRQEPGNVDIRLEFISLLEKSGAEPQMLIAEQEALVRAAPAQTRFAVELAKRYERAGQQKKALALADSLLAKFRNDASVLLALSDLYGQWNQPAKVISILETLVRLEPLDHEHYVNLGQQYWGRGDRVKAVGTWERILKPGIMEDPAEAHHVLSVTYLEVGRLQESLAQARAAVKLKPKDTRHLFQLGTVKIKNQLLREAERVFETTLEEAISQMDVVMARRARKQLLQLWVELNSLEREMNRRLALWKPDQVDRGMFLAEGFLMLGRWETALELFQKMRKEQPSLSEPLLGIIGLYDSLGRYREYITALEEAVQLIPHRAKDFYEQLSAAWAIMGDDEKARLYLQMALEKDARDSRSWAKAGELAMKLEDYKGAIKSFQEAIRLDPYEMGYYFQLAFLQQQLGLLDEASLTYHQIIARSSEDEVVERAARFALELGEIRSSLGKLERVLHPLSFTYAHRPVFSRLLLETYRRHVPQLTWTVRNAKNPAERKTAREELERVATRALKPLLESLTSDNAADMESARNLLAQLGNPNAAIPLIRMARRNVETARKKAAQKAGSETFSRQDLQFILKSLMIASHIGDRSIVADLQFFASMQESAAGQLLALWGLARLAPRSPEFERILQAPAHHDHMILACFTLARVSRTALVPVIENTVLPTSVRARCVQAYALHANERETILLDNWMARFSSFEMRTAIEEAMVYAGRREHLGNLARLYWRAPAHKRAHFAQGMLFSAGIRPRKWNETPISLRLYSSGLQQPWLNLLFEKTMVGTGSSQDRSWQQILELSANVDLEMVRLDVHLPLVTGAPCPKLSGIADLLKGSTGNFALMTPNELENLLSAWGPELALSGFSELCDDREAEKLGRNLFPRLVERMAVLKRHPYASVRRRAWVLLIVQDKTLLERMLAEEKWPDTRAGVLEDLDNYMELLSPFELPLDHEGSVRERILLLDLASHPKNTGHPEMVKHLLANPEMVAVSMGLTRARQSESLPIEWLLPALRHESLTISRRALEELRRRYPTEVDAQLRRLPASRREELSR